MGTGGNNVRLKSCLGTQLYLCLFLFLSSIFCLAAAMEPVAEANMPAGYALVAENEHLQLYLNENTTEIAVVNRDSGRVWYSNPNHAKAQEQILIEYYTPRDDQRTMNNRADSVAHGQFEITPLEGGVKIVYILGEEWTDEDYLPVFIAEERFNEAILSKIENQKDRDFVRNNYVRFSLEKMPEDMNVLSSPISTRMLCLVNTPSWQRRTCRAGKRLILSAMY